MAVQKSYYRLRGCTSTRSHLLATTAMAETLDTTPESTVTILRFVFLCWSRNRVKIVPATESTNRSNLGKEGTLMLNQLFQGKSSGASLQKTGSFLSLERAPHCTTYGSLLRAGKKGKSKRRCQVPGRCKRGERSAGLGARWAQLCVVKRQHGTLPKPTHCDGKTGQLN